jgi:hypothetical protein
MASPLDFFGSAPAAPQIDPNEHIVLARAWLPPRRSAPEPVFLAEPWRGRPLLVPRPFYTALCSNSSIPNAKGRLDMHEPWWAWAYLLMVDDVRSKIDATKVRDKLPPPTVVLETSAANFQHFWAYAAKVNPADQRSALAWLAEEGLTDKDSVGVHRLCRIPNSTSYKSEPNLPNRRPRFAARVVEFRADRLYPFADLGPFKESSSAVDRPKRLPIDPRWVDWDDVYLWLLDHDRVLRKPDAVGWAVIVCPWAGTHGSNVSNARGTGWLVRAGLGRFHCPHCRDKTRDNVIAWIEQQDPSFDKFARLTRSLGRLDAEDAP